MHTPAHELAEQHRHELAARLAKAGLSQDALSKELAARLAARVAIAPGEGWAGEVLPGAGGSQAADLAKLLLAAGITRAAVGPANRRRQSPGKPKQGDALLADAREVLAGMGVPGQVVTLEEVRQLMPGKAIGIDEKTPAVFDERSGIVYLIRDNEYWRHPIRVMNKLRAAKWLSTYEPAHLTIHEGIHARHLEFLATIEGSIETARETMRRQHMERIADMVTRDRIRKVVGRYAAIDPGEFVAEVGAALYQGKTYPDWVMHLYRQYGGPPITPRP